MDTDERFVQGQLRPGRVVSLKNGVLPTGVIDEKPVYMMGGVPGDEGLFRITHVGKHKLWARLQTLTTPSPHRVEAPCPVMDRCGGCPWQAVSRQMQQEAKLESLTSALGHLLEGATMKPWLSTGRDIHYRTRALMMTRHVGGRLRFGFYAPRTNEIVGAEHCHAQDTRLNEVLEEARRHLERQGIGTWRGKDRPGLLKAILYRLDMRHHEGLLTLVVSRQDNRLLSLSQQLMELEGINGVFCNIQGDDGGPVLGKETHLLAGQSRQKIQFNTLQLEVGPISFLQTHHALAERMIDVVRSAIPDDANALLDLYSGIGVFGLSMADRMRRVTLIESNPKACDDAEHNIKRLKLNHIQILRSKTEEGLTQLRTEENTFDAVILDPPRSGCAPSVLDQLCTITGVKTIVYVSCNPKSLARDLDHILTHGPFTLHEVTPVDMFVHTPHIETIAVLKRSRV